uniref:Uncharacterized protein n=1 Tax=Arundo donax TaxID=35708 RepID=A0A0A8Y9D6_ARUDO
MCHVIRGTQSQ